MNNITEYSRILLTPDEFKLIQVLIKTQKFNPDPVLAGLRKKFSVDVINVDALEHLDPTDAEGEP